MSNSAVTTPLPPAPGFKAKAASPYRVKREEKLASFYAENIRLPGWAWGVFLVVAAYGGMFTPNAWLTAASIMALPVFISLLWFRGEPPVMVFACTMQWLQGTVVVFYTNYYQVSLTDAFGGPELAQAAWLSLVAVLALAGGMRLALVRRPPVAQQAEQESSRLDAGKIFPLYLAAFVFFNFLARVAFAVPAIRQPLLATAALRWVLLILLAHAAIHQRRGYGLLAAAVVMEVAVGLLGFFS